MGTKDERANLSHTEKLEDMSSPINDISNVTENIAKLNAATRIGGKGTVRRKTKRVSKASSAVDEKRLAAALQKLGISSVPVVTEATIRTKDEIISFDNAKVSASVSAQSIFISGTPTATAVPAEPAKAKEEEEVKEIEAEPEKKEDKEDDESDTDDDMPTLDEDGKSEGHKVSKNEKKVRKAIDKFGFKEATGFTEMRVQTGKNIVLCIENPAVKKLATGRGEFMYAVFGKVDVKDHNMHEAQAEQMMRQLQMMQEQKEKAGAEGEDSDEDCPDLADVNFEEAGEINEDDLKLVMDQAGVSKAKAIAALNKSEGDVVNAIMALSE